jgi:hypothetical protein
MLRRIALVRTYVSEERIASIIRVTSIGELGRTLEVTSNLLKAIRSSETSVPTNATRRHIQEDGILRKCVHLKLYHVLGVKFSSHYFLLTSASVGKKTWLPNNESVVRTDPKTWAAHSLDVSLTKNWL